MPDGFHEVSFPMPLAFGTSGGPERRTDIVHLSNGYESRNSRWRDARRRYDAGSGVKSADDLYKLVVFFEARQGSLNGFRFKDPIDFSSASYGVMPEATDQDIGVGDGVKTEFQLIKSYRDRGGQTTREIHKPVQNTVKIAVAGIKTPHANFVIDYAYGLVEFTTPPIKGSIVSAGYEFDIPVRFDVDHLDINLSHFNAGHVPLIPLVEIKS